MKDDDKKIIPAAIQFLTEHGYTVLHPHSGEHAAQKYLRSLGFVSFRTWNTGTLKQEEWVTPMEIYTKIGISRKTFNKYYYHPDRPLVNERRGQKGRLQYVELNQEFLDFLWLHAEKTPKRESVTKW